MAITTLERTQIEKVFIAFLNAAPSITYLDQLVGYAGRADVLAKDLSKTDSFLSIYPVALTNDEFAGQFVANFIGSTASDAAKAYVKDEVVKSLNAGVSRGDTLFNVVVALQSVPDGDPTFGTTKKAFENKVAVADYYAVTKLGTATDLATLHNVIAGVTASSDVSSSTALDTILSGTVTGQTFTLTNGADTATANVFEAPLVYTPGGNDRINSLQDEDSLTGTGTNPTLNLVLGAANDASSNNVMPTLNGIETINLSVSSNAVALDMQDATGTQTINVTRVGGNAATVTNMDGDVVNLSVQNTAADADVTLTYRNTELVGNQTVALELDNANIDDLVLGGPAAGSTQQVETINLTVVSDSYINDLDLRQDGDAATGQTLNIVADGALIIGEDTDGDGNVIEHANGLVEINGLTAINVSGAGDVTLGEVGSGDNFVLNGATATGNIAANVTNAAGDDLSSFTTGTGNDTLIATAGLAADIDTNAGDDTVTITGNLANTENAAGVDTAASITTDEGADTVTVSGNVEVNTAITTGAGNDIVTVGGRVDAAVVGNTDSDVDGNVNAGEGDDTLTFGIASAQTTTAAATLEAASALAGDIAGGAGTDTMTITAEANVTANAATLAVTGVETLNLVARFATTDDGAANNLANSTANTTADFTVDLARFDADLAAVSIDNQDRITLVQNGFDGNADGDLIAVVLNNVVGEAISITSVETTRNAGNTGPIVDALGANVGSYDVQLTLNQATNAVATDVQTLSLTGDNDFDVSINDNGADQIEELTLNITGAGDHGIDLSDDFENTLTIAGAGTGELTIINVQANTVNTTAHTGNVWVDIDEDSVHTITTGAGNDVLDLLDDTVATTDALDLGNGTDRIIVDTTLGDYATANSSDDEVFEGFVSIEEVELRGDADLVMNEDGFATGVTRVIVDASSTTESGIRLGTDFDRALRVDVEADANMDMENDANVDLDVRVAAGADANTTDVDFTDAGINNTVALTVTLVDTADNMVDIAVGGDNLDLTVADGSIDSITLVEGTGAANGDTDADGTFDAGETDNDRIVVTVADAWSTGGSLTIDASAIDNFDANSAVVGFDSLTTGGATIDGLLELDSELTIRGTANNDTITGGDEADTLTGSGGNDTFVYSFANANDSTSQSADTITDFNAGDIITVAATLGATDIFLNTFATVASLAAGDNSLDGAPGALRFGDSFFSTDTNQFVVDVDGNGDVQDGVDLVINVANFSASQVQYTITGGAGANQITTGAGNDTINDDAADNDDTFAGGAGADTIVSGNAGDSDVFVFNAGNSGLTVATSDIYTGTWTAGLDTINMAVAGAGGNYAEADVSGAADLAAVLALANTALDGTVKYYVGFNADTVATDIGLLFIDNDMDGSADEMIRLVGVDTAGEFDSASIV